MSRGSSPQDSSGFPLYLVISDSFLSHFDNHDLMESMRRRSQVAVLTLTKTDSPSPDDRGLLTISDKDFDKVMRCFRYFVDEHTRVDEQDRARVVMLIPERMVAQIIGKGGKQINKFSAASRTNISILDRSLDSNDRKVSIEGEHGAIETAVGEIYRMILRNRFGPQENTVAKFIIPSNCAGLIIGRDGYFTKQLRESNCVDVKIVKAEGQPCTDSESIVTLSGSLSDCKSAVPILLSKISESLTHTDTTNSASKEKTRMIIPSFMAVKVIGRGGSTIREIMKNASGSSIHVMSEKNTDRDQKLVEVNIRGPLAARIEATILILDKIDELSNSPDRPETRPRSPVRRSRSRSRSPRTEISIAVPDILVSRLIGKRGDNVKALMSRSSCIMNFQQSSDREIQTPEGNPARLCTVQGSTRSIAEGVKLLLEQIQEFEKRDLP